MSLFRLVLCLAGLAVYLLTKQTLPLTEASESVPLQTPDSGDVIALPLNADGGVAILSSSEPTSSHAKVPVIRPDVVGFKKSAE